MRLPLHWRLALWSTVLVGLAFVVFGFTPETFLFAGLGLTFILLRAVILRSRIGGPLSELTHVIQRATGRAAPLPAIVQGKHEIEELSAALDDWSENIRSRTKALSEARTRLESVLSAMVEGVLVFEAEGRIVMANQALESLLDMPRDPRGRTCLEVFRNESLDLAVRRVLAGEIPDAVEFQTGSGRTVRARLSPVVSEDGARIEAAVTVLHDVTDIRQVDRVRRDFVANVSHEFKTPLTSIRGYAETMLADPASASRTEFLETIYRNARYLESLVNDLLALARMESAPPSSRERVDLGSIIGEQIALRRKLPGAESLNVEVDCPPIEIRADRGRLAAALSNLIDNAIRYNRPGGAIRIRCRRDGPHVRVSVIDSGFGIPADELPRIFERFYRVDKSRMRDSGGTGLGLAIARHAVESQGGVLTVESKVGSGSAFTIRLPAGEPVPEEG